MSKIIKAVFGGSAYTRTEKVFRFDTDDYLKFYGVDLPETYQVHFSNSVNGESKENVIAEFCFSLSDFLPIVAVA